SWVSIPTVSADLFAVVISHWYQLVAFRQSLHDRVKARKRIRIPRQIVPEIDECVPDLFWSLREAEGAHYHSTSVRKAGFPPNAGQYIHHAQRLFFPTCIAGKR